MKTNLKSGFTLLIQESVFELDTDNNRFSCNYESEIYKPYTDDLGKLYKNLISEYGRVKSKIYVTDLSRLDHHIGWTFIKRVKYSGSKDTYLQETWISLYQGIEQKKTLFKSSLSDIENLYIGEDQEQQKLINRALAFAMA